MPQTIQRARRRFPIRADLDQRVDFAYLQGGIEAAVNLAEAELGWRPEASQVLIAIGRNAWLLGELRGNQRGQIRNAAAGICMPRIDPDGTGAEAHEGEGASEDRTYFASIDRHFGIEIEFNRGQGGHRIQSNIVTRMIAEGLSCEMDNWNHTVPHNWRMRPDGTVTGGELVSPILHGVDGHHQVRTALRQVREAGGVAGQSQGMHIHHDVRDHGTADMIRLVANLRRAEQAILGYVPNYRWDGRGAHRGRRLHANEWGRIADAARNGELVPASTRSNRQTRGYYGDRYVSFNFNATIIYGSVEFRALGNTLNAIKIRTWIRVGQALIWYGKQGHELPTTVNAEELMAALVTTRALPRREAERFLGEVTRRRAAA